MEEEPSDQRRRRGSSSPPYSPEAEGVRSPPLSTRSRSRSPNRRRSPLSSPHSRSPSRSRSPSPGPSQPHQHRSPPSHRARQRRRSSASFLTALQISGLTQSIVEEHLDAIFSTYGKLARILLPRVPRSEATTSAHRGIGYIEYRTESLRGAQTAQANMDGGQIDGAIVRVELIESNVLRDAAAQAYEEEEYARIGNRQEDRRVRRRPADRGTQARHEETRRYERYSSREWGNGHQAPRPRPHSRSPEDRKRRTSDSLKRLPSRRSRSPDYRREKSDDLDMRASSRSPSRSRSKSEDRRRTRSRSGSVSMR